MHDTTQETVSATFLEIVERLTFMFGEVVPKADMPVTGHTFTEARMTFTGDLPGALSVAVPREIMPEIAANILGLDAEDLQCRKMMTDAVAEMLNVVCGHVIMDIAGADANFKLQSPVTRELGDEEIQAMIAGDCYIGFLLDDHPAFLGLSLES